MADTWAEQDFEERERRHYEWLCKCPICCVCGEAIQDERRMNINGDLYHFECADDEFGEDNEI